MTPEEVACLLASMLRVLNVVLTAEGVAPLVEAGELTAEDVICASEAFDIYSDALDDFYGDPAWLLG